MSIARLRSSLASASPAYLALSCFGLAASPALAQEQDAADSAKPAHLGGVTVSDTAIDESIKVDKVASPKFTQPLQDTPQTIQVISKELFNQQGATTLTEALRNSPGVGTFYAGENGSTSTGDAVYMRGVDSSGSIFVDGIRDIGTISRDTFNTEQVEVEKGPAGTDNGRTSAGGSINMVSKRANMDTAVSGTATVGTDGQKRGTADFNQAIGGIPNAAVRFNVMWQDSDVAGRDHVNNSRVGVASSFGFGLGTSTRAYLNLMYVDQNNVPDGYVPTIGIKYWEPQAGIEQLEGHPVDSSNFYGTRQDHDDVTAKMATFILEHDFSDSVKLTNSARWGRTDQDYQLTSFMTTAANIKWTDIDDLSSYTMARSNVNLKDISNKILTDQLNLRADFATGAIEHNLSVGVEFTSEQQYQRTMAGTGTLPRASLYDPDWNDANTYVASYTGGHSKGKTNTQSFYAFDTAKFFNDMLLVTGGVRVDHYKLTYFVNAPCATAAACGTSATGTILPTTDLKDTGTLFNWKLGAVFKPVPAVSLYANYALSQQPPGGANFTLSSAVNNAANPNMDPQKADTFEAGVKWGAFGGALALNAAVFRTKISNEINSADLDDNGNPTQTGKKRVQGVELSAVGSITQAWQVSAGYTYQDAKVLNGPNVAQDGTNYITYTPKNAATLWTTYSFPFGIQAGGGVRYVSGLHRGTDGAVGTPVKTDGYTVVDAILSYALTQNIKLRANAYNLFDKHYVQAINKSGYRYTPGTPRTFLFSADFQF